MNLKRSGKTNTASRKGSKPNQHKQEAGSIEEQVESLSNRMLAICCMAAAVGSLLFLAFFFSSDMRGNIIAAKAASIRAERTADVSVKQEVPDLAAALRDPNMSREDALRSLKQMSDAEFKLFVEKITGKNSSLESAPEAPAKVDVVDQIKSMDEAEFDAFIDALSQAAGQQAKEKKTSLRMTLEEAYAEAERLYPGQIDGSKRLKLIEDLNSKDFMYYVAEEGDTLIQLSRTFGVPLGQLVELNGIHDADRIPAGMILLFPSDTEQP
ncbi:LysM peptidoglycan-binding domain-containing protein [Metabacillus sp. SLBN-84]